MKAILLLAVLAIAMCSCNPDEELVIDSAPPSNAADNDWLEGIWRVNSAYMISDEFMDQMNFCDTVGLETDDDALGWYLRFTNDSIFEYFSDFSPDGYCQNGCFYDYWTEGDYGIPSVGVHEHDSVYVAQNWHLAICGEFLVLVDSSYEIYFLEEANEVADELWVIGSNNSDNDWLEGTWDVMNLTGLNEFITLDDNLCNGLLFDEESQSTGLHYITITNDSIFEHYPDADLIIGDAYSYAHQTVYEVPGMYTINHGEVWYLFPCDTVTHFAERDHDLRVNPLIRADKTQ
jgi:hypothetical protein